LGRLILIIAAIVGIIREWMLTLRFPKTFIVVNYFLAAWLGGRRRRW
jgi:hypothetical protein